MERLWAPWRLEYILSDKSKVKGCIFCGVGEIREEAALKEKLILKRFDHCFVIMNLYPYNNGHIMIVPYQHTGSPAELPPESSAESMAVLSRSVEVLKESLNPDGFNIGMNLGKAAGAGVADHLHWHIVPRWLGDVNFMPVLSETRVLPQHIRDSYRQLKPAFDKIIIIKEEDKKICKP